MRRLTRVRDGDRGAIAMIVAMLFGFGVMLALGALTVDVGNINADRRQLQNGADAVALSAAQTCAKTGTCDPTATTLQDLANANAADNATSIRRVDGGTPAICGNALGLLACPASTQSMSNLQECPVEAPAGVNYVRVYTETKNSANNKNILPYFFGAAITGIEGANQQACATVAWGPLTGRVNALPLTFSYCAWQKATGATPSNPGVLQAPPTGTPPGYGGAGQPSYPPASAEQILFTAKAGSACKTWNGHNAPGGFGGVDEGTGTKCSVLASVNGWLHTDSGNDAPCKKDTTTLNDLVGTVVNLPIFDCMMDVAGPITGTTDCASGNGENLYYHVAGYGAFFISGYHFSGDTHPSILPGSTVVCPGSERCISGWFTKKLISQGEMDLTNAPNLGTTVLQTLG